MLKHLPHRAIDHSIAPPSTQRLYRLASFRNKSATSPQHALGFDAVGDWHQFLANRGQQLDAQRGLVAVSVA